MGGIDCGDARDLCRADFVAVLLAVIIPVMCSVLRSRS